MKKTLILIPFIAALCSINTAYAQFPDVSPDHKNYEAINYLNEKGIINGYQDGTFGPENPVNRAEATKIAALSFNIPELQNSTAIFPDVLATDWFFPYVMGAKENGIINGHPSGDFKPADPVNLAELLKIIVIASNVELPQVGEENIFLDVSQDAWFAPHALYAKNNNIALPTINGNLNASQSMTRGEFAEVVYRMLTVQENNGTPFKLSTNWDIFSSVNIPFKLRYSDNWIIKDKGDVVSIIRPDHNFNTQSETRIYPNSATAQISIDENVNSLNKDQYFNGIKGAFTESISTNINVSNLPALEVENEDKKTHDYYVYLPDGQILTVYTEYGDGDVSEFIKKELEEMLTTFEYSPVENNKMDYSDVLSEIFKYLLIENKGMEMLNTLPEKIIIETDTIGVGTGPVDYYYSETVNYTFKYERNGDVILDKRHEKTSTF